jgi:hypothetical protein
MKQDRDRLSPDEIENLIEEIDDDLEILEEELERENAHGLILIQVENNDDASVVRWYTGKKVTIGQLIDQMYAKFNLTNETGDRLTRRSDGADVFPSRDLTVGEYLHTQHEKKRIEWAFQSDMGGA